MTRHGDLSLDPFLASRGAKIVNTSNKTVLPPVLSSSTADEGGTLPRRREAPSLSAAKKPEEDTQAIFRGSDHGTFRRPIELLKEQLSLAYAPAQPRLSRRETPFALIDRLIGTNADRIGILSDDSDEFDIYRELDALPQGFRWKAAL